MSAAPVIDPELWAVGPDTSLREFFGLVLNSMEERGSRGVDLEIVMRGPAGERIAVHASFHVRRLSDDEGGARRDH